MSSKLKKHESIGCCGIDCCLCPRYHTIGSSACPGCGGTDFLQKHPSCGFLTCCTIKKGLEVCAQCAEYPCSKFDSEQEGYDSFVTHRKVFTNQEDIQQHGLVHFLSNQHKRKEVLSYFLNNFDDGRSKSFFCISCTLLPLDELQQLYEFSKSFNFVDKKEDCKQLRYEIQQVADLHNINVSLHKKTRT
jgi:hypothetical protein